MTNPKRKKRKLYNYRIDIGGRMGVILAHSLIAAKSFAYDENGRNNVDSVRRATPEDVDYFLQCGGGIEEA